LDQNITKINEEKDIGVAIDSELLFEKCIGQIIGGQVLIPVVYLM
jgi:hypothetical protein